MTNQRSPLDSLNMRRERRPLASLDELNHTLSMLENHLFEKQSQDTRAANHTPEAEHTQAVALDFLRHEQPAQPQPAALTGNPHKQALAAIADELQRLRIRTELKQATAANERLQLSETRTNNDIAAGTGRVSAADRFITGTSSFTASASTAPDTDSLMRRDFEELKRTVETLAREESLRRMSHRWDALDERFDNFEQKQSEKLSVNKTIDPALAAITARLEDLHQTVEQLPDNQAHSLRQLDERLDEISRAILATSYNLRQPEQEQAVLSELDRRFADLTHHLDAQYHNSTHKTALNDDRFIQALEDRLDHIVRQVTEQTAAMQATPVAVAPLADQQLMRNLEKQLGFITEHLSNPESRMPELAEIKPRLDTLERAIDINRDIVLGVAREAAEEAIRQVVDKGSARDTGFAYQLADDLKSLEQLTRDSDERNSRTFDRVHDTLLKIAERLGQIEKDNILKPPHMQASHPANSRDQVVTDRFDSQFSIPQWGSHVDPAAENPFSELRNQQISQISAGIEAEKTEKKQRKSLLSGIAQAVRGAKSDVSTQTTAPDAFQLENSDLLTPASKLNANLTHEITGNTEQRTDQTLAPMPDLNAIIRRVRSEQRGNNGAPSQETRKSDLISAARHAVQAAADETGRLRNHHLNSDIVSDEVRNSAPDKPKRSLRKPILLAIGAIIIAVTGLQLGNSYLAEHSDNSAPQSPDLANIQPSPALVPTSASALDRPVIVEDKKQSLPTITTLGNNTDTADHNQSTLQITSLNHDALADDTEQPPLGSHPFPSQPLSATPMAGSTQAVLKPVVVAQPVASAFTNQQPLPETAGQFNAVSPVIAAVEPSVTAQDFTVTQSIGKRIGQIAEPVQASAIPAAPQEAGPIALRNAAAAGDARALYEIGMRYTDGRGVTSNFAEAAKWYALSAERGFAPAQYRLGNFNEKGLGLPRDTAKATELYEQAAIQGNASAMHNLAVLYAMGAEGTVDNDKAAKWFFKAAELGVKDSQFNLGILTAKGLGRAQNLEESYKWFALAANASAGAGSADADAAEKRDQVAKSLKPEQLEHAINLTKLWKPKTMVEEANSVQIPDAWSDNKAVTSASVDMKKAIRNIQLILKKNGYDAGTPDGMMGNKTREAISAFQKASGMKPTGEVDQRLVEALLTKNS